MIRLTFCVAIVLGSVASAQAAEPALRVGFAEVDLTPKLGDKPVYMAGFGHDRQAKSVLDPIMARAIVLDDGKQRVAIVSPDLVGFFLNNVNHVRAMVDEIDEIDEILITATHNHEGPDTLGIWGPNAFTTGVDPDYLAEVEKKLAQVIKDAVKNLKPTTAVIGKASDPDLLRDSRRPIILHDELVALRFDDPETKKPVGILVQWNCHPETLADENTALSADYVAYTVKELRERFDCPVVYVTGTVGGLMTTLGLKVTAKDGTELEQRSIEKTKRYGQLVGQLAVKALKNGEPVRLTPLRVKRKEMLLPVENKNFQLAWQIGVLKRPLYEWNGTAFPEKFVKAKDLKGSTALHSEVAYWKLGELEIAVIPGEIYPELVLGKVSDPAEKGVDFPDAPVEPSIYGQLKGKHKMIVGLGNDEIGYILPKRSWDAKPPFGYGYTKAPYGEVNSLGPETGPLICEAFRELTEEGK